MKYIVNANQMKEIDNYTINNVGIPSMVLMERASLAVAEEVTIRAERNDKILILIGNGNNGGDGLALARILIEKNFDVDILFLGNYNKLSKECLQQYEIFKKISKANANIYNIDNEINIKDYFIIIDAIFGTGLSKNIQNQEYEIIEKINKIDDALKIAVDIPSGINASTGKIMGIAFKSDITVTFGFAKVGMLINEGREYSGKVIVKDIGFPKLSIENNEPNIFTYEEKDLKKLLPKRDINSNKGTYGKVLVVAGSKNIAGASYFSAKSAYKIGCGLVKICTVEENRNILQTLIPEAILDTYSSKSEVIKVIKNNIKWANVIVVGCGMGVSEITEEVLKLLVNINDIPIILDADAINVLSKNDNLKQKYFEKNNIIFTPHLKELERLTNVKIDDFKSNIIKKVVDIIKNVNGTIVFKDARTLVVNKNKKLYLNLSGNSGMSVGGMGDILTGIIAGLIAQNIENFDACCLSVYIQGLVGDIIKQEKGEYSLLPEDIIENMFKTLM